MVEFWLLLLMTIWITQMLEEWPKRGISHLVISHSLNILEMIYTGVVQPDDSKNVQIKVIDYYDFLQEK